MTLQEALKIGTNAEGYIKCTFAEMYDENGRKLFSIQREGLAEKQNIPAGRRVLLQTGSDSYAVVSGMVAGADGVGATAQTVTIEDRKSVV